MQFSCTYTMNFLSLNEGESKVRPGRCEFLVFTSPWIDREGQYKLHNTYKNKRVQAFK